MPESSSSGFAGHQGTYDSSSPGSRESGKRQHPSACDVPGSSGSSSSGKRPRRDDQAPCGSKPDCMTCPKCKCCHHCGGKWATKTQWRDWRDLEMHFDGGSRPPKAGTRIPGLSGAGAIIWSKKREIVWKGSKYIGERETNNTAEYEGLILGLRAAKTLGPRSLLIKGDSMLVIKQLDGSWEVHKPHLEKLRDTARKEINEMMTHQKTKIPELQHHRRRHNNAADCLANCAMNSKKDTSEFACPADPGAAGGGDDLIESSTQMMTQPRSSGESSSAFTSADLHLPAVGNAIETEIVDDDEYADIEEAERAALSQSSCGMGSKAGVETEIVGEGELVEIAAIEASYSGKREQHGGGDGGIQTEIVGEDELSVIDAAMSQSSHLRSPPGNLPAWMPGSTSGAAASSSPAVLGKEPSSQRSTGRKTPGRAGSSNHVEEDCPVENFEACSSSSFSCRHSAPHAPDAEIERILLDSPPTKQQGAGQDAECGASDGGHRPPEGANCQASEDGIERILVESPSATARQGQRVDDGCGASGGGHRHAAVALSSRGGDASGVLFIDDPEDSAIRHQLEGDSEREEGSNEVCPIANGGGFASGDLFHQCGSVASGDGVGARMMGQMGYSGGGLGSNGQGMHEPIQARPRAGRAGLGGERGYGEGGPMNARPKEVEAGLGGENGSLKLDERQMAVYDACMGSKNVFLTGKGGSGKTFLLKKIIGGLRDKFAKIADEKGNPDGREEADNQIFTCAPTGVAALLCGGITLHSLLGCGVPTVKDDFSKMDSRKIREKWLNMKVLVIDEISMVQPVFLDYLDEKVRNIRGVSSKAFGGMQLIVSGDFCQLPCVTPSLSMYDADIQQFKEENKANMRKEGSKGNVYLNHIDLLVPIGTLNVNKPGGKTFAFQTNFWKQANFEYFELTKSHRQSDQALIDALAEVRSGNISRKTEAFFKGLERDLPVSTGVVPTEIFCMNKEVDDKNEHELKKLSLPAQVYKAKDSVEVLADAGSGAQIRLAKDKFFSNSNPTPAQIELRVGAQVMCTQNLSHMKLVNGSRGVVKKFETGEEVLADMERELQEGKLKSYEKDQIDAQKLLVEKDKIYPVVYFEQPDVTFRMRPVLQTHDVYLTGACKRVQIPLRLAWALTVHKCQGASLDKVTVQLEGAFENGQAYVALSRAKCVEGLQVKGFNKEQCMSDRMYAKAFHDKLSKGDAHIKDFVRKVPAWFERIIDDEHENVKKWRDLHLACNTFKRWVQRWMPEEYKRIEGQRRGCGPGAGKASSHRPAEADE